MHSQAGCLCSLLGEHWPRGPVPWHQPVALCQVQPWIPPLVETHHSPRAEVWKRFPRYILGCVFGKDPQLKGIVGLYVVLGIALFLVALCLLTACPPFWSGGYSCCVPLFWGFCSICPCSPSLFPEGVSGSQNKPYLFGRSRAHMQGPGPELVSLAGIYLAGKHQEHGNVPACSWFLRGDTLNVGAAV